MKIRINYCYSLKLLQKNKLLKKHKLLKKNKVLKKNKSKIPKYNRNNQN
jgi:hypothetical protein